MLVHEPSTLSARDLLARGTHGHVKFLDVLRLGQERRTLRRTTVQRSSGAVLGLDLLVPLDHVVVKHDSPRRDAHRCPAAPRWE